MHCSIQRHLRFHNPQTDNLSQVLGQSVFGKSPNLLSLESNLRCLQHKPQAFLSNSKDLQSVFRQSNCNTDHSPHKQRLHNPANRLQPNILVLRLSKFLRATFPDMPPSHHSDLQAFERAKKLPPAFHPN